jgi:hypothetical protein
MYPTIVSMIYNINKIENPNNKNRKKINDYIELSKKFILTLPYPLIIFIENNEKEIYDYIYETRKNFNLLEITYIYQIDLNETYFYKDLSKLEELQKTYFIINGDLNHETPMYIILNNNKFFFMEKTIELNPFNSSHFIWMDFGINHVAQNTEKIHEWINVIPDKIKQLCINPYTENVDNKQMFQVIYHHTAGGLFSGSKENMLKYIELFKKKTEQIYNENWYQIDEAVMTMVQRENPDLFEFFYGDYHGIVSNYLKPIHNMNLILRSSQKYIDANKTKQAFDVIVYCIDYFNEHLNDPLIYLFLNQHIIVDYYNNNKLLLDKIIYFMNLKLTSENQHDKEKIYVLLENNKANIDLYENKDKITK